jgi:phosphate:Na+ symporter
MIVFYGLHTFVEFSFLGESANAAGIAVIHSLFNIGATILLFPFSDLLVKLAEITIPNGETEEDIISEEVSIDERFLGNPAFAMELCRAKVKEMAEASMKSIALALEVIQDYDAKKAKEVKRLEEMVDTYEDVLGSYLVKISSKNLSLADSQSMSMILHSIGDFERISDHAIDIVKSAEEMHEKELSFTKKARRELETLCRAIHDICDLTMESFYGEDLSSAFHVEPLEEVIDTLTKNMKEHHIKRLKKGKCTIEMGFILDDILTDLERVSDHCSNIAVEMITIYDNDYSTHEYFKNFSDEERAVFRREYEQLLQKYPLKKSDTKKAAKE